MKYSLLSTLLFLFVAIGLNAQDKTDDTKDQATKPTEIEAIGGPQADFESIEIDYGTINQGDEPLRIFTFLNSGNEPLVIKNAKGSCGCTVPDWPREPIMPGEAGEIKVRYDTNRVGGFQKTITLTTNVPDQEKITLRIKGKVNKIDEEGVPKKEKSNPF